MEFKDWLNARYEIDAEGRNKSLEKIAFDRLKDRSEIIIIDLGAGTGSNFRYYYNRIPVKKQHWVLVDQDSGLLKEARRNIVSMFDEITESNEQIGVVNNQVDLSVEFQRQDIFQGLDLNGLPPDIIVSNALFDLATEQQFNSFLDNLDLHKSILLLTTNYENTFFTPSGNDDRFVGLFHQHMNREQSFGQSMGPDCVRVMAKAMSKKGLFYKGESNWTLKPEHKILQQGILDFILTAIKDLDYADEEFEKWFLEKRSLLEEGGLEIGVDHQDFLLLPKE